METFLVVTNVEGGRGDTGMSWVEARDATECPENAQDNPPPALDVSIVPRLRNPDVKDVTDFLEGSRWIWSFGVT